MVSLKGQALTRSPGLQATPAGELEKRDPSGPSTKDLPGQAARVTQHPSARPVP